MSREFRADPPQGRAPRPGSVWVALGIALAVLGFVAFFFLGALSTLFVGFGGLSMGIGLARTLRGPLAIVGLVSGLGLAIGAFALAVRFWFQ